ncbi:helix-turn-helix domain-containing protein [Sporomusa sp.]|uniref:helix-turn-helix domain-containing protein n=1 Tax=Sporomusa sp. TaxID=2078658 RepID=UPI0039C9B010
MVARTKKRMTIRQLSALCNISRTYLSLVENGHTEPSPDIWIRLAKLLECRVSDLKQ